MAPHARNPVVVVVDNTHHDSFSGSATILAASRVGYPGSWSGSQVCRGQGPEPPASNPLSFTNARAVTTTGCFPGKAALVSI